MEYKNKADLTAVKVQNIRANIMGTTSFEMKSPGMRKFQDFIVYPISKDDAGNILTIQSDTRFGKMSLASGVLVLSSSHQNGAYNHSYQLDKIQGKTFAGCRRPASCWRHCLLLCADAPARRVSVLIKN